MPATLNLPTDAGANESPPRASVREDAGLVDRRRWTSFLTWAFVLAEMAGRDGFLPTAAHAGDDDAGLSTHGSGDTAPIVNNLPNISVSTATDGPDAVNYQHASLANLPAATGLSSELAEAKIAPAADMLAQGTGAGGGSGHVGGAPVGEAANDAVGVNVGLGAPDLAALSHLGAPLDLGLHLDLHLSNTAHGLLGGLADDLGNLPLGGGLLEEVVSNLASTTGSGLEPVVSLVGVHGDNGGAHGSDVASPGQFSFGDYPTPASGDELATQSGGYTNYGIALNLGASDIAHGSAEAMVHADALGVTVLDSMPTDHLPGGDLNVPSDALHLDQSLLRTASDILA